MSYTCEMCRGTFESDRSDEEALIEAQQKYGELLGDDPAVVCDDCWKQYVGEPN